MSVIVTLNGIQQEEVCLNRDEELIYQPLFFHSLSHEELFTQEPEKQGEFLLYISSFDDILF